jgi:hypothetical protein
MEIQEVRSSIQEKREPRGLQLVVMTACSMHVTMAELIRRGIPYVRDLHTEMQCDARERMVAVEHHFTVLHLQHAPYAVVGCLELHSFFHRLPTELVRRNTL